MDRARPPSPRVHIWRPFSHLHFVAMHDRSCMGFALGVVTGWYGLSVTVWLYRRLFWPVEVAFNLF